MIHLEKSNVKKMFHHNCSISVIDVFTVNYPFNLLHILFFSQQKVNVKSGKYRDESSTGLSCLKLKLLGVSLSKNNLMKGRMFVKF